MTRDERRTEIDELIAELVAHEDPETRERLFNLLLAEYTAAKFDRLGI